MLLKRIIIHWTAGTYHPCCVDLEHYHFLITDTGAVYKGNHRPEDNENCKDDNYAAHTGGGNTGSIGVALCGMAGFKNSKNAGKYPLTKLQCERLFWFCAILTKQYKIPVTPDTIMTHYEFGKKHPKTTSAGKIDIIYLPPYPDVRQGEVGDFIRNKIKWYFIKND